MAGASMRHQFGLVVSMLLLGPAAIAETFYIGGSIGVSMIDDTVKTDATSFFQPSTRPNEIPLNGRALDSNETAYGIFLGWRAKKWLAVEFGYTDLGKSEQSLQLPAFVLVVPPPIPAPIPPGVTPFPPVITAPLVADRPTLSIEEWSLTAKFSKPLISGFSANWSVGVTNAKFDAGGQLTVSEVVTLDPLVINSVSIPYVSPDSEIGYKFGFGFAWKFSGRFSADIGYLRHDLQVIDVDTVTLQLILAL